MIRVLIINSLGNVTSNNYNFHTTNNNSKKTDNYNKIRENDNNERNYNFLNHYKSLYYIEDNNVDHNHKVNRIMQQMSDLWQVAKQSPICLSVARLMRLWGHENYNFLNLGHDITYLDHIEQDFNFEYLGSDPVKPWYNFIKFLEVSEEFEREFGSHQFSPVSWLQYQGIRSEYVNGDWTTSMLWLNPEELRHTTCSGRVQVYADNGGVRCSFHSPTQGQYAVVGTSGVCIRVELESETVWTISRVDPIVKVLMAFGLSREDSYKVLNQASYNRTEHLLKQYEEDRIAYIKRREEDRKKYELEQQNQTV